MIVPGLTERKVQDCIKLGITAELSGVNVTGIEGHFKPEHCNDVTAKKEGLISLSYMITMISKAYKVKI